MCNYGVMESLIPRLLGSATNRSLCTQKSDISDDGLMNITALVNDASFTVKDVSEITRKTTYLSEIFV